MPLTRPYDDTLRERAQWDPEFRSMLLPGAIEFLLSGEVQVGKIMLRHSVNATVGFEKLGELTGKSSDSLRRMLTTEGDPTTSDLFEIIGHIRKHEGIRLEVKVHSEEPAVTQSA